MWRASASRNSLDRSPATRRVSSINWADGDSADTTGSFDPSTGELTGTHTYAEVGIYHGVVTFRNSDGLQRTPFDIKVDDAPLTSAASPINAIADVSFTGPVATLTDANPSGKVSDFSRDGHLGRRDGNARRGLGEVRRRVHRHRAAHVRQGRQLPDHDLDHRRRRRVDDRARNRDRRRSPVACGHRTAERQGQHNSRVCGIGESRWLGDDRALRVRARPPIRDVRQRPARNTTTRRRLRPWALTSRATR